MTRFYRSPRYGAGCLCSADSEQGLVMERIGRDPGYVCGFQSWILQGALDWGEGGQGLGSNPALYQPLPLFFPRKPLSPDLYLATGSDMNFSPSRGIICLQQCCIPQSHSSLDVCPQAEAGMGSCLVATGLFRWLLKSAVAVPM